MARPKTPDTSSTNGKVRSDEDAPVGKITLEQLSELVADPSTRPEEREPYFRVHEDLGAAFGPVVELNPDTVHIPDTDDARSRSALILNGANWLGV